MRSDPLFTGGPPHHNDSDDHHHDHDDEDFDDHQDDHDDNDFHSKSIRLVEFVYHPGRPGGELMLKNIQTVRYY